MIRECYEFEYYDFKEMFSDDPHIIDRNLHIMEFADDCVHDFGILDNGAMACRISNALKHESEISGKSISDILTDYTRKDFMDIPSIGNKSWKIIKMMKERYLEAVK